MIEVVFIRHGETDWNLERRLQGHHDIALNAEGLRQATALGAVLLNEAFDAIFSSDLQRAVQTAEAIAAPHGMTISTEVGLRERCYGALEGLCPPEMALVYPEAYAALQIREVDARYPPGIGIAETLSEFSLRALNTIQAIFCTANLRHHQKIVIVTHGGVLDCVYRSANAMNPSLPRNFKIPNAAINRVRWDGAALRVIQWADVTHLIDSSLDEVAQ